MCGASHAESIRQRELPTTSLDEWIVRTRPSRAAVCVPTICRLSLHPPTVTWHRADTTTSAVAPAVATVDWTIRGRRGRPVRVSCEEDRTVALGQPHPATSAASLCDAQWPAHATCTGAGGCQSIPYLKSHLQKCVRKGLAPQAVATTKQLLKLSVVEGVRRLAVIMVEDVALHPQAMGVLLWWTVVLAHRLKGRGQGATLRCVDVPLWLCEWLLGLVHVLCTHPVFVRLPNTRPRPTPWQRVQGLDGDASTVSPYHRDAMYSLYLRATYGGLKGDVALLEQAAEALWRGETTTGLLAAPVRPVVWDSVGALPVHAWDLDAIDFHVVPRLFELVERGDEERERPPLDTSCEEESTGAPFDWKRMMWENGSMTNVRRVQSGGVEAVHTDGVAAEVELYGCGVWAEWLPRVRPLQRWLVRKSYG